MILRAGHGQHVAAIAQDYEAGFFALQKRFNDDFITGLTKAAGEHGIDRGYGLGGGGGDDDALARRQATGLDHQRCGLCGHPTAIEVLAREAAIGRCGDAMACQKLFAEDFRAFQLCRGFGWTEAAQAVGLKQVGDAGYQRHFGADDGQRDVLALRQGQQAGQVIGCHTNIAHLGLGGRAGVAGCDQHLRDRGRLRALPSQCVFAATAADDQNAHVSA